LGVVVPGLQPRCTHRPVIGDRRETFGIRATALSPIPCPTLRIPCQRRNVSRHRRDEFAAPQAQGICRNPLTQLCQSRGNRRRDVRSGKISLRNSLPQGIALAKDATCNISRLSSPGFTGRSSNHRLRGMVIDRIQLVIFSRHGEPVAQSRCSGLLDRLVKPGDDGLCCGGRGGCAGSLSRAKISAARRCCSALDGIESRHPGIAAASPLSTLLSRSSHSRSKLSQSPICILRLKISPCKYGRDGSNACACFRAKSASSKRRICCNTVLRPHNASEVA